MNAEQYANDIAIPTLKEALGNRGDRRLNYLACISLFHVLDYVAASQGLSLEKIKGEVEARAKAEFNVVQGVCNGTKHAGGKGGKWLKPGAEKEFKPFGFGPGCGGFDEGRWDHPGLAVTHGSDIHFLDRAAQVLLLTACRCFPNELGTIDLSFLDTDLTR